MSLKKQVISGISWVAFASIGRQALQFMITIVLARLLTPDHFGLVAMISVFINFAALFSELGFSVALVQYKEVEERHLSSVFWLNIAAGIVLTILMGAASPLIAGFYNNPLLAPMTMAIALNFTIGAFNDVQTAILEREMAFRRLTFITLSSIVVGSVTAIVMAALGFGVWSLIGQTLMTTLAEVVVMWVTTQWKPRLMFEGKAIRELLGFSANLLGFQVFNYWLRNLDNLLIGRYVDQASLGLYTKSYSLMLLPVTQITRVFSTVMFPALSRIQDDPMRVKRMILRLHRMIALMSMPLIGGLLVVADSFVITLLGPKWAGMVPMLRVLCVAGFIQPVTSTTGLLFQSQGHTQLQFRWGIFVGIVTLINFLISIRWGVMGIATGYAIQTNLLLYPVITISGRLVGLGFGEFSRNLIDIFLLTLLMMAGVAAVGLALPSDWPHWARLVTQVSAGISLYGVLTYLFNHDALIEVRTILKRS